MRWGLHEGRHPRFGIADYDTEAHDRSECAAVLNAANAMRTTITKRIQKLELGAGLIETEESRRTRELVETIRRRRAARRAREGLPPEEPDEADRKHLRGLTLSQVIRMRRDARLQTKGAGLSV